MTLPRRFLPKQTQAITRRCAQRTFRLKPTPWTKQLFEYALGHTLSKCPTIKLHAMTVEPNHYHLVVSDCGEPGVASQIPAFMRRLNSLVARALNAAHKVGENLWKSGSYGMVEVCGNASLEEQLVYAWVNPVKDGLVERPEHWPGLLLLPEEFGTSRTVSKPKGAFFGGRGGRTRPPGDPDALALWQAELAREEEEAIRRGRERDGRKRRKGKGPGQRRGRRLDADRGRRKRKELAPEPVEKRDRSKLPETVELRIEAPPGYDLKVEDLRAHFRGLLEGELQAIYADRRRRGRRSFLGVKAILARSHFDSAGSTQPTFGRNPCVACKGDTDRRIAILRELQAWRAAYREAWEAFHDPDQANKPFPLGTFLMLERHAVALLGGPGPPKSMAA